MTAIIGGIGHAAVTSKAPAHRRGDLGPSSHTSFHGRFSSEAPKTHFTEHQHARLEQLEGGFVHGGAAPKVVVDGVVENLSHVRIRTPPPKEKLAEPPVLGCMKRHPAAFGGFEAHKSDNENVTKTNLLYPQRTFRWLEAMSQVMHRRIPNPRAPQNDGAGTKAPDNNESTKEIKTQLYNPGVNDDVPLALAIEAASSLPHWHTTNSGSPRHESKTHFGDVDGPRKPPVPKQNISPRHVSQRIKGTQKATSASKSCVVKGKLPGTYVVPKASWRLKGNLVLSG